MREVRTPDTHGPGRQTVVTLSLSTGEGLRLVLGAGAARSLLETLLQQPHLRNVAATLGQPLLERAMGGASIEGVVAMGADHPDVLHVGHRRPVRRRRPTARGGSPLRLVRGGCGRGTSGEMPLLDRAVGSLGRSRRVITEMGAGLGRCEVRAGKDTAYRAGALLD